MYSFALETRQCIDSAINAEQGADDEQIKKLKFSTNRLDAAEKSIRKFIAKYRPKDIEGIDELLAKSQLDKRLVDKIRKEKEAMNVPTSPEANITT